MRSGLSGEHKHHDRHTEGWRRGVSHALVILYHRIFLLGQSFLPAVNDLLLGFLLYQSRLVPRALSRIGLSGGPVLVAGYIAVLCGLTGQHGSVAGLSAFPVAIFEFSLGVWLVVKGLRLDGRRRDRGHDVIGRSGHPPGSAAPHV